MSPQPSQHPSNPTEPTPTAPSQTLAERHAEDALLYRAALHGSDRAETLTEINERLDTPDFEEDINNHSIFEIITDICRDLGIHDDYAPGRFKRRTPEDVRHLNARPARDRAPQGRPPPPGHPPAIRPRPPKPGGPPPRSEPCQENLDLVRHLLNQIP